MLNLSLVQSKICVPSEPVFKGRFYVMNGAHGNKKARSLSSDNTNECFDLSVFDNLFLRIM